MTTPQTDATATGHRVDPLGVSLALSSAATFGAIPILAKLAFRAGITVAQLQAIRFVFVTAGLAVFGLLVARGNSGAATLRRLLGLAVFGCLIYGPQSFLFLTALTTLPATFVELLFYVYPALVVVGAWIAYRRSLTWRRGAAAALATMGAALVVGRSSFATDGMVVLAIANPILFSVYLLLSERLLRDVGAVIATAAITGGACVFWLVLIALRGEIVPVSLQTGWGPPVAIIGLATLWCLPALFAAVRRIGSDTVAVISTVEPVVTVILASAILFEWLTGLQAVGAALILGAVVLIQLPNRRTDKRLRSDVWALVAEIRRGRKR